MKLTPLLPLGVFFFSSIGCNRYAATYKKQETVIWPPLHPTDTGKDFSEAATGYGIMEIATATLTSK